MSQSITVVRSSSGLGFVGALTLLLIAFKLTGVISLSWIWVLSPIWITTALLFLIFVVLVLVIIISDHNKEKRRIKARDAHIARWKK